MSIFKKSILVIVGCLIGTSIFAGGLEHAPTKNGFYLTADIGAVSFENISSLPLTSVAFAAPVNFNLLSDISSANALNFSWGAGLGWEICPLFRLDATYTYFRIPLRAHTAAVAANLPLNSSTESSNASSNVYLLNIYLNLSALFHHVATRIQPYIGGGIGVSNNRLKDMLIVNNTVPLSTISVDPSSRTDFAYQIILGVDYRLITQFLIYVQYSYIDAGKYLIGPGTSVPGAITNHARFHARANRFSVGLRYIF